MQLLLIGSTLLKKVIKDYEKGKLVMLLTSLSLAYLVFMLLFIGVSLSQVLKGNMITYFIGGYFIFDFVLRLFFQRIRAEALQFVFLPIKKSSLIHFTLIRNSFNVFNLIPILVFTPVIVVQVQDSFISLLLLVMMSLLINWATMLLKITNSLLIKLFTTIGVLGGFSSIVVWGRWMVDSLSTVDSGAIVLLVGLVNVVIYYALFKFIEKRILVLRNDTFTGSILTSNKLSLLEDLLSLEIKLIVRNKRPLTYILGSSILVILVGQVSIFQGHDISLLSLLVFSAISIVIPLFYSQYLFSWESEHFGFILANTSTTDYIKAKFNLLTILFILNGVCLTPLIVSHSFNYYYLSIWIFELGLIPFIFTTVSLNNDRGLKLANGSLLNYEGTTLNTFILILLGPLVPLVAYVPFYLLGFANAGLIALTIIGILLILSRNRQVALASKLFARKKHSMHNGFKFD